jgi:hypothetical protein
VQIDSAGVGTITEAEFTRWWDTRCAEGAAGSVSAAPAHAQFERFDENCDGKFDRDEFRALVAFLAQEHYAYCGHAGPVSEADIGRWLDGSA